MIPVSDGNGLKAPVCLMRVREKVIFSSFIYCTHICVCPSTGAPLSYVTVRRSEDDFQESILSVHHGSSGDQIQVARLKSVLPPELSYEPKGQMF